MSVMVSIPSHEPQSENGTQPHSVLSCLREKNHSTQITMVEANTNVIVAG